MTDEAHLPLPPPDVPAYERPLGQGEPDRTEQASSRRITRLYVTTIVLAAIAAWIAWILIAPTAWRPYLAEAAILLAFLIVSGIFPLQFAFKQEMTFDLLASVLAALILPPQLAIPVCAIGYFAGYALRYRFRLALDCPFNAGIYGNAQAGIGVVFALIGIEPFRDEPGLAVLVGVALIAALVKFGSEQVLVALVIRLESRQPFLHILRDSTLGMQSAEQAMLGALIALAVIGALLARVSPFALFLLVVPAFALWLALRQNVQTRHRIEASLATAQRVAGIGSLDWDLRRGDVRWSDILFRILGYDPDRDTASTGAYLDRVTGDDREKVQEAFDHAAEGRKVALDHRILLPGGEIRAFNLRFNGVADRSGTIRRIVGTIHDVTERKQLEDRLQYQAYHDSLTGLPNRAFFMRRLESAFSRYARTSSIALLFLDLDRFKVINDTLGHEAGDELLKEVANRLQICVRPNDVVARLGGDEFIILLDAVETDDDILTVAHRIVGAINDPVELPGQRTIVVSTSVGIVRPTPGHHSGDELLRDADSALYRAKEEGRNRIAFFNAAMGAATSERLGIENDLRDAAARGELSLVYQPRVDLGSGRVRMVEALVRWHHPTRGEIPPARFIPIAEDAGLIDDLGRWIVQTAIAEARNWLSVLNPAPPVSLNITRKQLLDPDFPADMADWASKAGLSAGRLRVEVSEAALMADVDSAIEAVVRLRAAGFAVSVDDFGTGHSSLISLRRFAVDMLQLDHQFVTAMGTSRDAATVTQAVIGLARGLDLTVLAEGVERREQAEALVELGCTLGQGTWFSGPMPAAELLAWLLRNEAAAAQKSHDTGDPPNLRRLHGT